MNFRKSRLYFAGLLGLLCATSFVVAHADNYPDKPIKIMLGFAAGTPPDIASRRLGEARKTGAAPLSERPLVQIAQGT